MGRARRRPSDLVHDGDPVELDGMRCTVRWSVGVGGRPIPTAIKFESLDGSALTAVAIRRQAIGTAIAQSERSLPAEFVERAASLAQDPSHYLSYPGLGDAIGADGVALLRERSRELASASVHELIGSAGAWPDATTEAELERQYQRGSNRALPWAELKETANEYYMARLLGVPVQGWIAEVFGISIDGAAKRIAKARKVGLIPPAASTSRGGN